MESPPDWTSGGGIVPEGVLVAYGRAGTEEVAYQRAQEDVIAQISQILARDLEEAGVPVTGSVGEALEERAQLRVETQDPVERYRRRDAHGSIEQYLLYEYLPQDRRRDITAVYEATGIGDQRVGESGPVETSPDADNPRTPLEEARFLLADTIPESSVERRRRLEEIRQRAEEVIVTLEPRQRTVALGESITSSFTVTVQTLDEDKSLSDVPLRVEFHGPLVDGRRSISETMIRTDRDGSAQIPVGTPALAGTTRIAVEPVWLNTLQSSWEAVLDDSESRDLLSSIAERFRARAAVEVTSEAPSIPTAMIVLDRDIAGNPIGSADTMRGMAQEFMNTDFRIRQVELSAPARQRLAEAESISVADLYDILPFDVLSRTERVIVGNAHIVEFSEEDGFTVVVEVEAGAFDLRRDQVQARVSFRERISGSDARSAIRTAFQAAGRRLVRQIVPRLP